MFRETMKSNMDPKLFGVGSIIQATEREQYLVVLFTNYGSDYVIGLVNLQTFVVMDGRVEVVDPNHLSQNEVRELITNANLHAFSDYDYITRGLKK